jgi:hypothetical protein
MTITIDGTASTNGIYSAYVANLDNGEYYAELAVWEQTGERINAIAQSGIPIQLDEDFIPTAIAVNGINYLSAVLPQTPQPGEYVFNPYTHQLTIYGSGNAVILGERETIPIYPPLLNNYPWIFNSLPLEGQISINRSFEQHPSAQFEFESTAAKSIIQSAFRPGREVDVYGTPLRINSISIKELPRSIYPDSRVKVSVSFGGKWENYIDEPCFLKSNGRNPTGVDTPFQDPDCQNLQNPSNQKSSVTINSLLSKINVPLLSPALKAVEIPPSTPEDTVVNPAQLLQERVRLASGFEFWSNPSAVEVKQIGSTQTWNYDERDILGEIDTNYDAIALSSKARLIAVEGYNPPEPDFVNFPSSITAYPVPPLRSELPTTLAFEYKNAELTGEFSQPKEKPQERSQGESKPRYVKKEPKRVERVEGDKTAHVPLDGVAIVQVMSLCFDIGGQTKTRTTVIEENGTRVREINEIWGFAYTANSIYDDASKTLRGGLGETWKRLKYTVTQYIYDENTGYLLYVNEDGYNTVRYQQESADKPETLTLTDADKLSLYDFIQIPVISRTSYYLELMPNWSSEGLFELYKSCNRDGTSTMEAIINPNFAPPYYVKVERNESVSFASRSNPANKGLTPTSTKKLQPRLIVGEESRFEQIIDIIPATYQENYTGESIGSYPVVQKGEELQPQKYVKYVRKFKAQGQAIAEALEEVFVEEQTGDPPVAQRRADLYTREGESQNTNQNSNDTPDDQYRYFLQTPGYTYADPINGSESFALATTLEEALTGARAKLAIENWRQGLTETLQIPGNLEIKEGDRFNYFCNGEHRERVVLSAQHNMQILGIVGGVPKITCITSLQLGRYVLPQLTWNKVRVPKPGKTGYNLSILNVINALGNTIDWILTRSRRNP